jgi:predicted TIM-barrel fold metal-dependent hydrolase
MRRIDLHCYPGTDVWIASQGPYVSALGQYWGKEWVAKSESQVVADVEAAGVEAVLVAFDIESLTGAPPCGNDYVAALRDRHPGTFIQAWGAVDPLKGEAAIDSACSAVKDHHVLGFHFHPIMGHFAVDEPALNPLFETIAGLRVPVMIDVGTTGMGAGMPGGMGARLEHARPLAIDNLAARFPSLTIVAAHPGWPWTDEMTAVALHKGNVYWELSGWAPKYFPPSLRADIRGRLREKIMFGSDHPSLPYERILREWDELGYDQSVMDLVFHGNAERVLGLLLLRRASHGRTRRRAADRDVAAAHHGKRRGRVHQVPGGPDRVRGGIGGRGADGVRLSQGRAGRAGGQRAGQVHDAAAERRALQLGAGPAAGARGGRAARAADRRVVHGGVEEDGGELSGKHRDLFSMRAIDFHVRADRYRRLEIRAVLLAWDAARLLS